LSKATAGSVDADAVPEVLAAGFIGFLLATTVSVLDVSHRRT